MSAYLSGGNVFSDTGLLARAGAGGKDNGERGARLSAARVLGACIHRAAFAGPPCQMPSHSGGEDSHSQNLQS